MFMATTDHKYYSASLLHENLDIPLRYLRRLLTDLTKHGFIASERGRSGGFYFIKKLEEIKLSDIIDAVEGFDSFQSCLLGNYQCDLKNPCAMHQIWADTKKQIIDTLTNNTLADVKEKSLKEI